MFLDVLKFIFSDIWHYLGTLVLIYFLGSSISAICQSCRSIYQPITYNVTPDKTLEEESKHDKDVS